MVGLWKTISTAVQNNTQGSFAFSAGDINFDF